MKRLTLLLLIGLAIPTFGQKKNQKMPKSVTEATALVPQKKPTLMILPSDNWCSMRLFMTTFDNQGSKVKVPN